MYDIMQPNLDISEMFADRQFQRNALHTRYLNEQLVRVLKTIGYDVGFQRGQGQYLFDRSFSSICPRWPAFWPSV
jgi:ornithine--oxo-acid transaminase